MDIIKAHATKNLCYVVNQTMTPKGIVVHSTGANNPSLKRYVDCPEEVGINMYNNHWNTPKPDERNVCVHAFIGYDKNKNVRVAEILPLNICCWGVGSGKNGSYNYSPAYIQFEICEDDLSDEKYYRDAFSVAAEYTAYLCKLFNISIENIVSHKEAHQKGYGSNHADPEHWMNRFGENMDDFRLKVTEILNEKKQDKEKLSAHQITNTNNISFSDGDLVSISENAVYYSGAPIPSWVKNQRWYVKGNSKSDRIVIDENESGTNYICSPINKRYLKIVKEIA